jgi:hypothetical protein
VSVALNNITTADGYTDGNLLFAPGSQRITMHVRNAAVYYQLGIGLGGVLWRDEVFLPPGTLSGARNFDVVRVRSAVAGAPAQVTIDAGPEEDG